MLYKKNWKTKKKSLFVFFLMLLQLLSSAAIFLLCAVIWVMVFITYISPMNGCYAKIEELDILRKHPKSGINSRGGPYLSIISYLNKFKSKDIAKHFLNEKLSEMLYLSHDQDSKEAVKTACVQLYFQLDSNIIPPPTQYVSHHVRNWRSEIHQWNSKFKFSSSQEVFYFHHGLRFCDQRIRDYVASGDIMDIGAFTGDSSVVLSMYTNHSIYAYEISKRLTGTIHHHIQQNNDLEFNKTHKHLSERVHIINEGISNEIKTITINDVANNGGSISYEGTQELNVTTIDSEVEKRNMKLTFFKADVEGEGLNVLKGAYNTIMKQRPVISIAIYHSGDEFFGIHEYMKIFPNYLCEYHSENDNPVSLYEISVFYYPAELLYDNSILYNI